MTKSGKHCGNGGNCSFLASTLYVADLNENSIITHGNI